MSELFYLQDSRSYVGNNVMWWAENGNGYTTDISKAHVYTRAEAQAHHDDRSTDIPWPKEYIDTRTRPAVDMQYIRQEEGGPSTDDLFYVQDSRSFDGNDVLWWTAGGRGCTTDLRKAHLFTRDEALARHGQLSTDIPWPRQYIDGKTRPAVDQQYIKRAEALAGSGITLVKPTKARGYVIRCHQCGRFLSERQVFEDCGNCGADNRP